MATHPNYPGASSFIDRHGKCRWRYRLGSKTFALSGAPDSPEFIAAYEAAIMGEKPVAATITKMPGAALPRSFGAAWRLYIKTAEWQNFDEKTRYKHTKMAEYFLTDRIDGGEGNDAMLWKDAPVADFKRKHMKIILARHGQTPHKAKHIMVTIRKMLGMALDEEWIEIDPTFRISHRPSYKGWRPWTFEEMAGFEAFHKIGSVARAMYAVGFWAGYRVSDIVTLRRSERQRKTILIKGELVSIECFIRPDEKTDRPAAMPITPMLAQALDALPNVSDFYFTGKNGGHRSEKSATGDMAKWTAQAGLPSGCTIHGLRKKLGNMAAEGGASTRESMDLLNHTTLQQVELYSREAEQLRMANEAMNKVITLHTATQLANRKANQNG